MKKIITFICNGLLIISIPAVFIGYLNHPNPKIDSSKISEKETSIPGNNVAKSNSPIRIIVTGKS